MSTSTPPPPSPIPQDCFTDALYHLLDETFENVHGAYLDKGTSFLETLAGLNSELTSRPIYPDGPTVAAHVAHAAFYLDVLERVIRGEEVGRIDWEESWTTRQVSPQKWECLQERLHTAYHSLLATLRGLKEWDGESALSGSLAVVAHTAYHLGAVRLALGVLGGTGDRSDVSKEQKDGEGTG